nr:hypothetical protein [Candidatus Liberibacter asiaticus]
VSYTLMIKVPFVKIEQNRQIVCKFCQKWWLHLRSKKAATDNSKEEEEEKWNKLAPVGKEENEKCDEVIA